MFVAPIAQWIEQLRSKEKVGGSNPSRGAKSTKNKLTKLVLFFYELTEDFFSQQFLLSFFLFQVF